MVAHSPNQSFLQIAQDFRRWAVYSLDIGESLNNGALSNKGGATMEQQLESIVERIERLSVERDRLHTQQMAAFDQMIAALRKLNEVKSRG